MIKEKIAKALDFAQIEGNGCLTFQQDVKYSTWGEGCAVGRHRADQLVKYMREEQDTVILSRVVQATFKAGLDPDAVTTGFFQRISEYLVSVR